MINEYTGPLTKQHLNKIQLKARSIYQQQNQRCYNKSNPRFSDYGGKGIRVEYTIRQFIFWYEQATKENPGIKIPHCGRIDHSKNYALNNIRLEEARDNTNERNMRCGRPERKISVSFVEILTGKIKTFESIAEAARHFQVDVAIIREQRSDIQVRTPIAGWILIQ